MNINTLRGKHISIAGIIGAGKTELAEQLSKSFGLPICYENVSEPVLNEFYVDRVKRGYPYQLNLLCDRKGSFDKIESTNGVISDRSIIEDFMFIQMFLSEGNLDQYQVDTYVKVFDTFKQQLPLPDCIIYLQVTPTTALGRVTKRNRSSELATVNIEYLQNLKASYDKYFLKTAEKYGAKIITIDWNEDNQSIEDIKRKILDLFY